jgi:hypothetical protein
MLGCGADQNASAWLRRQWLFQENQAALVNVAGAHPHRFGERIICGYGKQKSEIAGGRQHLIASLGDQDADFRLRRLARPAIDKLDVKLLLELANLHRQRRLGDGAGFRGAAEMPVARERLEIVQLAKGDHGA